MQKKVTSKNGKISQVRECLPGGNYFTKKNSFVFICSWVEGVEEKVLLIKTTVTKTIDAMQAISTTKKNQC